MDTILHFIGAGGFVMYPLLLLSLVAGAVMVERLIAFHQFGGIARGLLDEVLELCRRKQFERALEACERRKGPVAAALRAVLKHREQEVEKIERFVEETGQEYFLRLERFLAVLDTTTTISPLLGLLGTIVGMIGAFNAISLQAAGGNNDLVLHGVAEALYATASGITIAVVCFVAYNYFSSRIRHILAETEISATKLINALSDCEPFNEPANVQPIVRPLVGKEHHAV